MLKFVTLQLKDTHSKICTTLGSDIAYSCYGKFLHSFVAGWEDDEKFKAYLAVKGNLWYIQTDRETNYPSQL